MLQLWATHKNFVDLKSAELTPTQIRQQLADLAISIIGEDKRAQFTDLITVKPEKANYGVPVTEDLKYTGIFCYRVLHVEYSFGLAVRYSRQNSVHVSPTVLFNGVAAPEISSKWGQKEWLEWLEKKLGKPAQ